MAYDFTEIKHYSRFSGKRYFEFFWEELTEENTSPDKITNILGDMSFWLSVTGSFGSGGHLKLQGSMDGSNWYTLQSGSADIDLTSAGTKFLDSNQTFRFVRPLVTAGTTVDVDVTLLVMP